MRNECLNLIGDGAFVKEKSKPDVRNKLCETCIHNNEMILNKECWSCCYFYKDKYKKDENIYEILVSGLWQKTTKQMFEDTSLPKKRNGIKI